VSVAVKKVKGVESVTVTLKNGLVSINLAPGNKVTLAEMRTLIKSNGFNPKEATVVVQGVVSASAEGQALKVSGTDEVLVLTGSNDATSNEVRKLQTDGSRVEVAGRIDPPNGAERLKVQSVKRVP
jgi:copper chaperone CopZ